MVANDLLKKRIKKLNSSTAVDGTCVLYVMSRDQRVHDNHALVAAQKHADTIGLPLAVVFCLYEAAGNRAQEHYQFMIDGLKQVDADLENLKIPFIFLIGEPKEQLTVLCTTAKPSAVYFDFNPLTGPRKLHKTLAHTIEIPMYVVDTHNVVPVWEASDKLEVGAYTLRPKLHKQLALYLTEPEQAHQATSAWPHTVVSMTDCEDEIMRIIAKQKPNETKCEFLSGEKAGLEQLDAFVSKKLERYAVDRNDPSSGSQSDLSPYLHFGQLSALRVALRMQEEAIKIGEDLHFLHSPKMPKPEDAETTRMHGIDSLIEELIVRKELADNYCYYQSNYLSLDAASNWAKETIALHDKDPREYEYSYTELDDAKTHDKAWNAAQQQLKKTGKMHGYMRMYWAKKIKEWTPDAQNAIDYLVRMNDFYSIDGGDPNGYAGIMWSVVGIHDRPWIEREIFGKIRYMNYGGLQRKFDIEAYEKQWL